MALPAALHRAGSREQMILDTVGLCLNPERSPSQGGKASEQPVSMLAMTWDEDPFIWPLPQHRDPMAKLKFMVGGHDLALHLWPM